MNNYIEFINNIKQKCSPEWLMPSQERIYLSLMNSLQTHKVLNIWGHNGVGKTLLGWILHNANFGVYYSECPDFNSGVPSRLILDNFDPSRQKLRAIRTEMMLNNVEKVLVITNTPPEDDIFSFELSLNDEDKQKAKHNLYHYMDFQIVNEKPKSNLHDLIRFNLTKEVV